MPRWIREPNLIRDLTKNFRCARIRRRKYETAFSTVSGRHQMVTGQRWSTTVATPEMRQYRTNSSSISTTRLRLAKAPDTCMHADRHNVSPYYVWTLCRPCTTITIMTSRNGVVRSWQGRGDNFTNRLSVKSCCQTFVFNNTKSGNRNSAF